MSHTRTEHNRLDWLAEYLVGLPYPRSNDVTRDLDAALCGFLLRPLARHQLSPRHVNLFRDKHAQRHKHLGLHQLFRCDCRDDVLIDPPQPLGKGRSRQANHPHFRIVVNEIYCSLPRLMRLVHDHQVQSRKLTPALQGLGGADLDVLVRSVPPVPRL